MPKTYANQLKDPRWQRKRLEVMERDNWQCRDTGVADESLQVHHCWYAKGGPWETPSEYLLTLTEGAHRKRQELESRAKKALGMIMARTGGKVSDLELLVESMECASSEGQQSVVCISEANIDAGIREGIEAGAQAEETAFNVVSSFAIWEREGFEQ